MTTVTEFTEPEVVDPLLSGSQPFKSFYEAERGKITKKICWKSGGDFLKPGVDAHVNFVNEEAHISLHRIPPDVSDAYVVAHELQHIVHNSTLKIPGAVQLFDEYRNLATGLNSAVQDLLVNRDLLKYGFESEIISQFKSEADGLRNTLADTKNEPLVNDRRFSEWAINIAGLRADFDFLARTCGYRDNSIFEWYESHFPQTGNVSKQIAHGLLSVDLDSSDSIKRFLQWFLTGGDLLNHIRVKS